MKNYFIVFHDKTKIEVSDVQADKIIELSSTNAKFITINGRLINFSNIAQIIPDSEYYKDNPDERTPTYPQLKQLAPYQGFVKKQLNTTVNMEKALKIWKRQRDNREVEIQTGGLQRLIDWGEKKLIILKKEEAK